jgi:hypothetical protein
LLPILALQVGWTHDHAMRVSMVRTLVFALLFGAIGAFGVACGSALPTPQEEQRVDDYDRALHRCKDDAKARDADISDYQRCADQVDRDYGRRDAGGA